MSEIDAKLAILSLKPQPQSHIVVDQQKCKDCLTRGCIAACPGQLWEFDQAKQEMLIEHSGCLECGTCLIVCLDDAVDWSFPEGTFGVQFRFG